MDEKEARKRIKNYVEDSERIQDTAFVEMRLSNARGYLEGLEQGRNEANPLAEALEKCIEFCVCQTESDLFIDKAKEVLTKYKKEALGE